jgi:hypothetical protein
MTDYEIRYIEQGDKAAYLDLYETVLNRTQTAAWFEWKYEQNPYVDHVPIVVATAEGEVVGARSFFALRLRVDDEPQVVMEPCDTMVHADHRRRGLFTRMTRLAIDRYEGRHPLLFNFPNQYSLKGNLELGWEIVAERSQYYRIERPAALVPATDGNTALRLAATAATPFVRAYYGLRDRRSPPNSDTSIRTTDGVPADVLADLYQRSIPAAIHTVRDRRFYDWRFDNPDWTYRTTIASTGGTPRAAVVTGTADPAESGRTVTKLTDVVPLQAAPTDVLGALLHQIVAENTETDVFVAPPEGIPGDVLSRAGFHADSRFPLSLLASETTHVVRSLGSDQSGTDRTDPDNWLLTFAERDMS